MIVPLSILKIIWISFVQIFSYLGAYEHLCELGYDKAQVEEALEMFSNSETKVIKAASLTTKYIIKGSLLDTWRDLD